LFGQKKHKNLKNKSFDFLLEQTFARASSSKTFARVLSLPYLSEKKTFFFLSFLSPNMVGLQEKKKKRKKSKIDFYKLPGF
jgi:hypothetical protein